MYNLQRQWNDNLYENDFIGDIKFAAYKFIIRLWSYENPQS